MSLDAKKVTDQQFKFLKVIWEKGEASVKDVQAQLDEKLAHTTVATVLSRLEQRGLLSSKLRGREKIFRAEVKESDLKSSMVSNMVSTLFQGDRGALLAHLVAEEDVSEEELAKMKALLDGDKS